MIKRKLTGLFVCFVLIMTSSITVFAEVPQPDEIIYLDDGSYIEITITEESPKLQLFTSAQTKISSKSTKTKTAVKTAQAKNSSGTNIWYVKVTGTFTYNGSSSSCTKSVATAASQHSSWSIKSKTPSKSGNTAKATATAVKKLDGTVTQSMTRTVSLTCSKTGNLS